MTKERSPRRNFIRKITGTALATSVAPSLMATSDEVQFFESPFHEKKSHGLNDQVNIAIIGM